MKISKLKVSEEEVIDFLKNYYDHNTYIEITDDEILIGTKECYSSILECGESTESYGIKSLTCCGLNEIQGDELEDWGKSVGWLV